MKSEYMKALLAVAAGGIFLWLLSTAVVSASESIFGLTRQPTQLTELYFDNYATWSQQLPKSIAPQKSMVFSFTIHNLEGLTEAYPYIVSISYDGVRSSVLASGVINLPNGSATSTRITYTFNTTHPTATVSVSLPTVHQSLHFFIPNRT